MRVYLPDYSRSGHLSQWIETEVCLHSRRVTQELTLYLVGVIERPTGSLEKTSTSSPFGISPPAPLRVPREIGHEGPNRVEILEPRPPSHSECSPKIVPGRVQEVTTDSDGTTDTRGSIVGWRDKVLKRWDSPAVGGDSAQEGEVGNSWRSC